MVARSGGLIITIQAGFISANCPSFHLFNLQFSPFHPCRVKHKMCRSKIQRQPAMTLDKDSGNSVILKMICLLALYTDHASNSSAQTILKASVSIDS